MAARPTTETHERIIVTPAGSLQGLRVAWGGVWSGFLVATGVFLLGTTLGLAIGVTTADLGLADANSARDVGIGAAAWTGITLLIALFVGGWVATRTGVVHDRAAGLVEGVLVWVLSMLTVIYMATSGVSMLANGIFSALGSVTSAAAQAAPYAAVTMWTTLAAMVIALIAALVGAMIGRRQVERRIAMI